MNTKETVALIQLTRGASIVAAQYLEPERVNKRAKSSPYNPNLGMPTNDPMPEPNNPFQQVYHFKNALGIQLKVGDTVVVHSRDTFALVKITAVNVFHTAVGCSLEALKNVVAKVDFTAYDAVVESEQKAEHELGMSELHERLSTYRSQVSDESFSNITTLLAAPAKGVQEEEEEILDEKGAPM